MRGDQAGRSALHRAQDVRRRAVARMERSVSGTFFCLRWHYRPCHRQHDLLAEAVAIEGGSMACSSDRIGQRPTDAE